MNIPTRRRIHLWSSPRNISTALMYSFAQRADTHVVDEPLYGHYLRHQPTDTVHPGAADVLKAQSLPANEVVKQLQHTDFGREVLVVKQMTHHLIDLDRNWLAEVDNVLLIRDPRLILASCIKNVEGVVAADIGYPAQLDLYEELRSIGSLRAVVDARRLLLDPAGQLKQLCQHLDLKYDPSMLTWEAGPRPEDGVWARYWYQNVHRSTGFMPFQEKTVELPPRLEAIAKHVQPQYQQLLAAAL